MRGTRRDAIPAIPLRALRGHLRRLLPSLRVSSRALKAKNSILWHDTVIGWLDQWLKTP